MGEQRGRHRIAGKIDTLPEDVKSQVNQMLLDLRYTYQDISIWLQEEGYQISKSSVGRYALRNNEVTRRLTEAQEQTKTLIEAVRNNPDADYTEGALQIMSGELTRKIAMAQEEWDDMDIEKAAKIMVSLSRTKAYKDKVKAELTNKMNSAVDIIKEQLKSELKEYPDILEKLSVVVERVVEDTLEND